MCTVVIKTFEEPQFCRDFRCSANRSTIRPYGSPRLFRGGENESESERAMAAGQQVDFAPDQHGSPVVSATPLFRKAILKATSQDLVANNVRKYGMQLGASRFVAGETIDECIPVLRG